LDVVFTTDSGFHLIDYLEEIQLPIVLDCIQTGSNPPGTLYVLRSSDMKSSYGPSPHYIGLLETLQLARKLLLNVPKDVIIPTAVVGDILTLGGELRAELGISPLSTFRALAFEGSPEFSSFPFFYPEMSSHVSGDSRESSP
jgi:hydrogenase maturation protease